MRKPLRKKVRNGKVQKLSTSKRVFNYLLEEELFSEFKSLDWIFYFQKKYWETNNRVYEVNGEQGWRVEHSIYRSVIKTYTPKDIKLVIDFLFDSSQDIKEKRQVGSFLLSSKWMDSVYRSAKLWQEGEYLNRRETWAKEAKEQKEKEVDDKFQSREWTSTKKQDKPQDKKVSKSVIRI